MKRLAILVFSHGSYSKGAMETVEMIIGKQENYDVIGIYPEDNIEEKKKEALEKISKLDVSNGLVMLTDIKGGSPFNISLSLLKSKNEIIYSGFSLQKLIEIMLEAESGIEEMEKILENNDSEVTIIKYSDLKGDEEDDML